MTIAPAAGALEWSGTPSLSLMSRYDENFRMELENEKAVESSHVQVVGQVVAVAERFEWSLSPRVNAIDYRDEREFDRNDAYFDTQIAIESERTLWTVAGGRAQEGTLTTAFENTGFTETDIDRNRSHASIGFRATPSERTSVSLGIAAQDIRFEKRLLSPLVDYRYGNLSMDLRHTLNERAELQARVYTTRLETEFGTGDSDSVGMSIAWIRRLAPTLDVKLGAGAYESQRRRIEGSAQRQATVDVTLSKRLQSWSINAAAAVETEPSAFGVLNRRERVSLDVDKAVGRAVHLGVRMQAARIASDQPDDRIFERRYGIASAYVNWSLDERFTLAFEFGARGQEFVDSPRARGAMGTIALFYRGRKG